MRPCLWILFAGVLAGISPAQKLRHGVAAADRVVIGRQVSAKAWGEHFVLHRIEVAETLKGEAAASLVVVDIPAVSFHSRPSAGETRLYCLQDYSQKANKAGLPESEGPFYRLIGYPGSNPAVGDDPDKDPYVRFARVVVDWVTGVSTQQTAFALVDLALLETSQVRVDAVRMLAERDTLRARLTPVHWGELISKTAGETDDIAFKISLAELCAEQRLDGLVDALCISMREVQEPAYARVVGRIARSLHGEGSLEVLRPHLLQSTDEHRDRLLLALGATSTESALNALLRMRSLGSDPSVDAALAEHASPRATAALKNKKN